MSSKVSTFDSFYASAPTTPSRLLFARNPNLSPSVGFRSVPNSPERQFLKSSCRCDTTFATPETTFGDKSSNVDDFEFATTRHFNGDELDMGDHFDSNGSELSGSGFNVEDVKTSGCISSDGTETNGSFNVEEVKTSDLFNGNELENTNDFNSDEIEMSDLFNVDGELKCDELKEKKKSRGRRYHESLPAMAFANELFIDESEMNSGSNDDEVRTSDFFNGHELENIDRFNNDTLETRDLFNVDEVLKFEELKEKKKNRGRRYHESLPAMAFADELFSDGKMMPLNPPPSQMSINGSSPMNPNARFRIPFTKSLWNDDFDPFMVALEAVREEKREATHRRAKSMLPLPTCTTFNPEEMHEHCLHSSPLIVSPSRLKEPTVLRVDHNGPGKSPIRLSEPKGVLFARRARMVKLGYNYEKPISIPEPILEESTLSERRRRRNTWHKMLSFHLRSVRDEKTEKDLNVEFARSKLKELSFKSKKLINAQEEKKEMQITKLSLVRYRPKLLLCMGYGAKYA
ncbi:hypothetical protein M5689_010644 [Euphorbia peplus]|nr:hypothetical protein M5689_010644 [Euphorbia peplus]